MLQRFTSVICSVINSQKLKFPHQVSVRFSAIVIGNVTFTFFQSVLAATFCTIDNQRLKMPSDTATKILPTPVKAESDKKEYRAIELPNGLRALLISDTRYPLEKLDLEEKLAAVADENDEDEASEEESEEESESDEEPEEDEMDTGDLPKKKSVAATGLKKSAAALCVGMGSFSDPEEVPGLAHFLEHMVFMGSKKYPDENAFDNFINKSGGFDNASTDCETTVFYFESQRRFFQEGNMLYGVCTGVETDHRYSC